MTRSLTLLLAVLSFSTGARGAELESKEQTNRINQVFQTQILHHGKIDRESYRRALLFVAEEGRASGFWRQVLVDLQKNGQTNPIGEAGCVRVLGMMLEADADARETISQKKEAGNTNRSTVSVCLGLGVVKELIARGELADNFSVDHYAVALARSRVTEASEFFHAVLRRQGGQHLDSAQFHAAVGLAQLEDTAGFEWLIANLGNTLDQVHNASPDGVTNWNMNTCCFAALKCLSGKEFRTKEEWRAWRKDMDKRTLSHHVHMVNDFN